MSSVPQTPTPGLPRRIWVASPRLSDLAKFVRQLLSSTRGSAWRGASDGLRVAYVLKRRGVRSLVPTQPRLGGAADVERATRVVAAVDVGMGMLPISATCLRRSITALRELERLGLQAQLHIGVRRAGSANIQAHAWLQIGDVVINDDVAITRTYVELAAGRLEDIMPALG